MFQIWNSRMLKSMNLFNDSECSFKQILWLHTKTVQSVTHFTKSYFLQEKVYPQALAEIPFPVPPPGRLSAAVRVPPTSTAFQNPKRNIGATGRPLPPTSCTSSRGPSRRATTPTCTPGKSSHLRSTSQRSGCR